MIWEIQWLSVVNCFQYGASVFDICCGRLWDDNQPELRDSD